jgi:hypothetical protein
VDAATDTIVHFFIDIAFGLICVNFVGHVGPPIQIVAIHIISLIIQAAALILNDRLLKSELIF